MTNHVLSVKIGALLASGFTGALSKGSSQLLKMGSAIKTLDNQGKQLASFGKLKSETLQARGQWKSAENDLKKLSLALKNTSEPSKKMVSDFNRARNSTKRLKDAYLKKRTTLHSLNLELKKSGVNFSNLKAKQLSLGSTTDKLKAKYQSLNHTLKARDANLTRRAGLRSSIFDMVAMGAAIGAPLKAAIDFESEMADVRKVVDFRDGKKGLQDFGNILKKMSRDIPISASGLAQIAASGGQLGVKEGNLPEFVNIVAKMSTAFDMMPSDAGDAMAKLSNIFKIPINEMASLGDAINHLSDNTAAKARDIVPVLARAGAQAKDFGLSAEETAALADAFIALGKPPQVAGTAINALLLKLNTASKQGAKFQSGLAELGIEATELESAIADDAQGALLSFLGTLEGIEKQQRAGILSDLFGLEYADDISLLAGSMDEYKKALDLINDDKKLGSMNREFENRSKTTANQLRLLGNATNELGINIGATLLPAINYIISVFRGFSIGLAKFTETFPLVSKVVFGTVFALIALKISAIASAYAFTFVKGSFLSTIIAFKKISAAMTLANIKLTIFNTKIWITNLRLKALAIGGAIKSFGAILLGFASNIVPKVIVGLRALTVAIMTNPVGAIVGGIAIAAGLLILNWERVKDFFLKIWDDIKPIWGRFGKWVIGYFKIITAPIRAIGKIWQFLFGSNKKISADIKTSNPVNDKLASASNLVKSSNRVSNVNNNNVKISVNAAPHHNEEQIADNIMRKMNEQRGDALFDLAY